MTVSLTRKRSLRSYNANAPSQPNAKVPKRTADGKENEAANEWYETLTVRDLRKLCEERGIRVIELSQ